MILSLRGLCALTLSCVVWGCGGSSSNPTSSGGSASLGGNGGGAADAGGTGGGGGADTEYLPIAQACLDYAVCADGNVQAKYLDHGSCWASKDAAATCTTECEDALADCNGQGGQGSGASGAGDSGAGGQGGEFTGPTPELELGTYLMTISASAYPTTPVLLVATIEAVPDKELTYIANVQALDADDRKTLVGPEFQAGPATEKSNGQLDLHVVSPELPEEANPLDNGPLKGDLIVHLKVASDFMCGMVTGALSKPFSFDLDGSTFTLQKVDGTDYPEPPYINCDKETADPL